MKILMICLSLLILPSLCLASSFHEGGDLNLTQTSGRFNAKNIFVKLNANINGELKLYHLKGRQGDTISGQFILDNHSRKNVLVHYKVVFKDRKGKVAQTEGHLKIYQGLRRKISLSDINLSKSDITNINKYDISFSIVN
jgi:hypothetical protein